MINGFSIEQSILIWVMIILGLYISFCPISKEKDKNSYDRQKRLQNFHRVTTPMLILSVVYFHFFY